MQLLFGGDKRRATRVSNFNENISCGAAAFRRHFIQHSSRFSYSTTAAPRPQVIVCNIMTTGAGINRLTGTAKRINRQLTLYARATATATANGLKNAAEAAPVVLVKLNNPRSTRDDGRAFDGLHLNARGYRAFGKALYEAVGPMMIAVEWKFWKSRLSGSLIEGVTSGLAGAPGSNKIVELKSVASKKAD